MPRNHKTHSRPGRPLLTLALFTCLPPLTDGAPPVVDVRPDNTTTVAITPARLEIWHGEVQRVGHTGDAQDVFNLMGHVEPWREIDTLEWRLNDGGPVPLSFRAYRRIAADGDFNADVPIGLLESGSNAVSVTAYFLDLDPITRTVTLIRETGATPLPCQIRWGEVKNPQNVGQYVDGRWKLADGGLRTDQTGYDRLFLIGEREWQDYEVRTSITVHGVDAKTAPLSGGNGVGLIARFAGHVTGGHRYFPSGQPSWGYQPFGAIGWLRWKRGGSDQPPQLQFFPGDSDQATNFGDFPFRPGQTYGLRFSCTSLPDDEQGRGVTRYDFKIWPAAQPEPEAWTWQKVQTSRNALREGALALVAHHVDVTFGDITITGQ
jgi:hypothetical protein